MDALVQQFLATSAWEWVAATLGLAYLLLAVRRNLLCWICAFASVSIYLVLFAQRSFYMHALLHVFYLGMAVYGFMDWRRGRLDTGEVRIESWGLRQHLLAATAVMAATAINGWMLSGTDSPAPYLDAFVTWGSVVTTWMVARRVIQNWLYWLVVDGVAAWLYFSQGLLPTGLLVAVYLGIVIRGFFVWRREQRLQVAV